MHELWTIYTRLQGERSGNYEYYCILACDDVRFGVNLPPFRRNVMSPWDLRSSGLLLSVERQSYTDVSGQHIGPILKVQDLVTLEDGPDTLYRNVGKGLPLDAA
jgi:hypothetical protein